MKSLAMCIPLMIDKHKGRNGGLKKREEWKMNRGREKRERGRRKKKRKGERKKNNIEI